MELAKQTIAGLRAAYGAGDATPKDAIESLIANEDFERAFRYINPDVNWKAKARWVDDGDRITSSGVSAGIDMSLYLIARLFGEERATQIANMTEYEWHRDPDWDPFSEMHLGDTD